MFLRIPFFLLMCMIRSYYRKKSAASKGMEIFEMNFAKGNLALGKTKHRYWKTSRRSTDVFRGSVTSVDEWVHSIDLHVLLSKYTMPRITSLTTLFNINSHDSSCKTSPTI